MCQVCMVNAVTKLAHATFLNIPVGQDSQYPFHMSENGFTEIETWRLAGNGFEREATDHSSQPLKQNLTQR